MPSVDDAFIGTGQFASGRNAQVIGQAANTFEQNLEGSVSNALETGYSTAGTQAGNEANILNTAGNTAANATQAQAANLQNAGTTLGNLASTQAGAQGAAATNLASTGQTALNTGITANSALQDVGQEQQGLAQQNINQAMTDFTNQAQWPQQEAGFLSDIIRGLPTMGSATTQAGQNPATTNQVGSVSPLSTLGGTILGATGLGSKKGGLIKGYAEGGQVESGAMDDLISRLLDPGPDDIKLDTSGMDSMPAPTQAVLPAPSTSDIPDDLDPSTAPISAAVQGSRLMPADTQGSPLKMASNTPLPAASPDQTRNLQLLAMARGMLTPAHSGGEALGNALGGYLNVGLNAPKYQGEEQDVVSKQIGNASTLAALARQNMINRSMGGVEMPLPNVPGMGDYTQKLQQSMQPTQAPDAPTESTAAPNGNLQPVSAPAQTSAPMTIMRALQIANGRVPASEADKFAAVTALQAAQFPVPAAMAEEAKQYGGAQGALPAKVAEGRSGFQMLRGAGNLPSSLFDPLSEKVVAEGAQQGIVPVGQPGAGIHYRLPPGSVNNGQSSTAQQNVPGLPPGSVQTELAPQQEELLKQGTADMIEKQRPAYEAAQQTLNGSAVIDGDIDKLGNTGWFAPGTGATGRIAVAKGINGAMTAAGFSPDKNPGLFFDPEKVGTGEELNKQTVNLGFNLARTMGARESQQVVEQAIKINPGLGTTYLGGKMVNSLIAENAQRTKDQYEYKMNALNNGVDPLTAETQFNKQYPGTAYVKRAISQFAPVQVNDAPWTANSLLPGTVVQYKKLPPKAIPAPKDYQFSLPPTNKQFGAQQ